MTMFKLDRTSLCRLATIVLLTCRGITVLAAPHESPSGTSLGPVKRVVSARLPQLVDCAAKALGQDYSRLIWRSNQSTVVLSDGFGYRESCLNIYGETLEGRQEPKENS